MSTATHEVTELLQDWSEGDETALDKLTPLVYAEWLKRTWVSATTRFILPAVLPNPGAATGTL